VIQEVNASTKFTSFSVPNTLNCSSSKLRIRSILSPFTFGDSIAFSTTAQVKASDQLPSPWIPNPELSYVFPPYVPVTPPPVSGPFTAFYPTANITFTPGSVITV